MVKKKIFNESRTHDPFSFLKIKGDIIEGENKGKEIQVESFPSYLTLPEKNERKVGIIVITDIFGFQLPNTRRVADYLASHGYTVIVPDLFDGDIWLETSDWSKFGEWRAKHPQVASYDRILHCAEYLKQRHGVQKLGVIGFCWGLKINLLFFLYLFLIKSFFF